MLANQRKALGIVQQRREVDQVGHSHMAQAPQPSWGASLAHEAETPDRCHPIRGHHPETQ
jgi:hypothetical protein